MRLRRRKKAQKETGDVNKERWSRRILKSQRDSK